MHSLRISRWREPRLNWLAIVLLIVGYVGFGALASTLHAQPDPQIIATSAAGTDER